MDKRLQLQVLLESILGSRNVYFQPPSSHVIRYPAIVYERDSMDVSHAGNQPYSLKKRYQVTVIDKDPDSEIPDKIAALPLCRLARHFASDNLNHDVFNIYY